MVTDVQQQIIKIHASRAKALFLAGVAAGFVVFDWLFYFVWPTPDVTTQSWLYQEPSKTSFFIIWLLVTGAALVAGLYLTVTPRPLVQLDSEGMVYELYPFLRHSVRWADVSRISAVKGSYSVSAVQRSARLTLWFTIKPHAVLAYGGKSTLKWTIGQALLPISLDELVHSMQRYYHKVTFNDSHALRRLARNYASIERDEHAQHGGHGEHPAGSHAHDAVRADAAQRPMSRHLTFIVVAFFVGVLVGLFGINMVLSYVVGMPGGALVLLNVLLALVFGWLLKSLLWRSLLSDLGRQEE